MNRRIQILLLLLVVVCVPAATRASQHLNTRPLSPDNAGFSKSSASAPEKARLIPDVAAVRALEPDATDTRQPGSSTLPDLSLTPYRVDCSPESIRAPPGSFLQ
jgi:hypothetical protein